MKSNTLKLSHVVLHRLQMPLVSPFRTSFGTEYTRNAMLVQVVGPDSYGWGECVADAEPLYSAEYADGAQDVISRFLLPRLNPDRVVASTLHRLFGPITGNPMAKGGVEAAILDAECRFLGQSFADRLGATKSRVPSGVSVGIQNSIGELLDTVEAHLAQGYVRIKLKIEPGHDIEPVRAVRERFGEITLQVDANAAYSLADAPHLAKLDAFDLLLIEQPLAEDDVPGHAELSKLIRTPVCLDESIHSVRAAVHAIEAKACRIINIKPGRVGGYLEAVKIHDLCLAAGIATWCGGMLETGVGRAANVALAALPGFTLPGDTSASDRYFHKDVTDAFVLDAGHLNVPTGPGIGVDPIPEVLKEFTVSTQTIKLG
jgi:o-succinylbenzoate synthase